jgi:hypothetical protein
MCKTWITILSLGLALSGCGGGGGGGSSSVTPTPTPTAAGPSINVTLIDQPVLGRWSPTTVGDVNVSGSGVSFTFSRPTAASSDTGSPSGQAVSTNEATGSTWFKTDLELKDSNRNCSATYNVTVAWDKNYTTRAVDAGDGSITGNRASSTCPPSRFPEFIAWVARFSPDEQKQFAKFMLLVGKNDAQVLFELSITGNEETLLLLSFIMFGGEF